MASTARAADRVGLVRDRRGARIEMGLYLSGRPRATRTRGGPKPRNGSVSYNFGRRWNPERVTGRAGDTILILKKFVARSSFRHRRRERRWRGRSRSRTLTAPETGRNPVG